jgi:hypothetical protein
MLNRSLKHPQLITCPFFCGVGLTPPLGPFFRSPRFRFLRSLCSSPLGPLSPSTAATHWSIVHSPDDTWGWLWSNWWSERRLQGKPKNSKKTCPSATSSHHKSHMTRPGLEPRVAAVGSQLLTAWAMARPITCLTLRRFLRNVRESYLRK